jgi:16S rRNA G1207 methylase RsmC
MTVAGEHYFTAQPTTLDERQTVSVRLNGTLWNLQTSSGVFSPAHLDQGTEFLLEKVPPPEGENLLDLGCGWGPLALTMALQSSAAQVWAVDVNVRALELTAENARRLGLSNIATSNPEDMPPERQFHTIWSNPPIRIGKPALHELLTLWLSRLHDDGQAYLVVNKNLGADSLATWLTTSCPAEVRAEKLHSSKGFRILRVTRNLG